MFLTELKNFSHENWWVYILLIISLVIIYITGTGDLLEIFLLFIANFLGNLGIMVMQSNYTNHKNKIGSVYHIGATAIFLCIGTYGLIFLDQSQYIIWQIAYTLAAIKAFSFYNFKRDLKIINEKSFVGLNLALLIFFFSTFHIEYFQIMQVIGFSLITTGLVSIYDTFRYWLNVVGIFFLSSGSLWGVYSSFINGNVDGIALGFFILTLTVFVYYIKLLPKYLK